MVRHFSWALGVAVLLMRSAGVCGLPADKDKQSCLDRARSSPRDRSSGSDPKLRQEIGHHRRSSRPHIEAIFSSSIQALRDARKELDALEAVLSRTIQENTADVFTVSQQVDKVEAARSAYNKARTVMLYRMNLVLHAGAADQGEGDERALRRTAPQGRRGAAQARQERHRR